MQGFSRELYQYGSNTFEKCFFVLATNASFLATPSPSIRCNTPVLDRYGKRKKVVTTPDCLITETKTKRIMYVEITQSSGEIASKQAQLRVIKQASKERRIHIPYTIVTGNHIVEMTQFIEALALRNFLLQLFGWNDLIGL